MLNVYFGRYKIKIYTVTKTTIEKINIKNFLYFNVKDFIFNKYYC